MSRFGVTQHWFVAALTALIAAGVLTQGGAEAGGGSKNSAVKSSELIYVYPDEFTNNIFSNRQSVDYLGNKYSISGNKIVVTNTGNQKAIAFHTFPRNILGGIYSFGKTALLYSGDEESGTIFSLNLIDGSTKPVCSSQNIKFAVSQNDIAYLKCNKMIGYDLKNNKILWSREWRYLYSIDFANKIFLVGRDQNFSTHLYLRSNGKMFSTLGLPIILKGSQDLYVYFNPSTGLPAITDDSDQYLFFLSKVYLNGKFKIQQTESKEFTIGPREGCKPPPWVNEITDDGNEVHMPRLPLYESYNSGRFWFSQKDTCGEFLAGVSFTDSSITYKSVLKRSNNDE